MKSLCLAQPENQLEIENILGWSGGGGGASTEFIPLPKFYLRIYLCHIKSPEDHIHKRSNTPK